MKKKESISLRNSLARSNLRADCKNCFGYCCTALYFSSSEGFPADKEAGTPCPNLQPDFRCKIHRSLIQRGLKGCAAYECFGAGQKVARVTFGGQDWRMAPEAAKKMFEAFIKMRQLHEMLWYLEEALTLQSVAQTRNELDTLLIKTEGFTRLDPDFLIELDTAAHRADVNKLLRKVSRLVRAGIPRSKNNLSRIRRASGRGYDLIGADLNGADLKGEDLRGSCLIAADLRGADLGYADLTGADMRDADLRGTDLSSSIFLTQAQINTAKGDLSAKLPPALIRPLYWR